MYSQPDLNEVAQLVLERLTGLVDSGADRTSDTEKESMSDGEKERTIDRDKERMGGAEKCDEVKERMSDGEKDRLVEIDATNDEVMKENVSETGIGLVHND